MRNAILALATILTLAALLSARAQALEKYDPYPWCAVYGGRGGGGTNCGFLTIEQCRATVSGIGGSCEPNQFYNPGPTKRSRKKQQQQY
ncbi:MAG TPA: DUF3551 domain-containing protein [Pseudolabrys sp.]|nr:DUF3551 domain-containing protein [Pseudolabrys sp.]